MNAIQRAIQDIASLKQAIDEAKTNSAKIAGQLEELERQRMAEFACATDQEAEQYIVDLKAQVVKLEQDIIDGVQTLKTELGW